jgi:hypothetical protein
MNIGIVYLITNDVTNGKYVGITTQKLHRRWKRHQTDVNRLDYPLYRAIRKYGIEHFQIQSLKEISSDTKSKLIEILNELEIQYVLQYQSFIEWNCGGYNLTVGGGMENISVESRKKQSDSITVTYKNNPNLSIQHAKKLHTIYESNPEYGKNIANKLKQLYIDEPWRRSYIGDFQRGNKHHGFDDTIYTFRNIKTEEKFVGNRYDFYNKYNLSKSKVCLLLQGKRKTHKQWVLNTQIHTQKENIYDKQLCKEVT